MALSVSGFPEPSSRAETVVGDSESGKLPRLRGLFSSSNRSNTDQSIEPTTVSAPATPMIPSSKIIIHSPPQPMRFQSLVVADDTTRVSSSTSSSPSPPSSPSSRSAQTIRPALPLPSSARGSSQQAYQRTRTISQGFGSGSSLSFFLYTSFLCLMRLKVRLIQIRPRVSIIVVLQSLSPGFLDPSILMFKDQVLLLILRLQGLQVHIPDLQLVVMHSQCPHLPLLPPPPPLLLVLPVSLPLPFPSLPLSPPLPLLSQLSSPVHQLYSNPRVLFHAQDLIQI